MLKVSVEDIMTDHIVTIPEDATIGQAAHLLLRFRINGILVVDADNKKELMGVFTTTDLLRLLHEGLSAGAHRENALKKIAELKVGKVSSKVIIKIKKHIKTERLIGIMHKRNVHTIPIYDGEKLVGVVGRHDVLNAAFT